MMRVDPAVFWRLSLHEWLIMQRGYFQAQESMQQREWERARMVAYYALIPHVKRGKMQTFQSLMRFPWEGKGDVQKMTNEEIEYIVRKYGRFYDAEKDQFVN